MRSSSLRPQTAATLDQLRRANWFGRVGSRDTERAIVVSSWAGAMEWCAKDEWDDLRLEAANQYRERLLERAPDRFQRWNDIALGVNPAVQTLVDEKTREVVAAHNLPARFVAAVRWDILYVCMEAEYANVYPPGFYAAQGYWYVKGHFPCGWHGKFPAGTLVIF